MLLLPRYTVLCCGGTPCLDQTPGIREREMVVNKSAFLTVQMWTSGINLTHVTFRGLYWYPRLEAQDDFLVRPVKPVNLHIIWREATQNGLKMYCMCKVDQGRSGISLYITWMPLKGGITEGLFEGEREASVSMELGLLAWSLQWSSGSWSRFTAIWTLGPLKPPKLEH